MMHQRLTEKNRMILAQNFATLLASGMSLKEIFSVMREEFSARPLLEAINAIEADIEGGISFWRTLEKNNIFPTHFISLIRIGEESGHLLENFGVVAEQYEKEREFAAKVYSAILYPIVLLCLTTLVGLGVSWFVLPRLAGIFNQLNIPFPWVTRTLIGVGFFFGAYGTIFVPLVIGALILLIYILFVNKKTRSAGEWVMWRIPIVSEIVREVEVARMGYGFGTLLKAGLPVREVIVAMENISVSKKYKIFYKHLRDKIEEGINFQKAFSSYKNVKKILPPSVQAMISSGEQSGKLVESFLKVGMLYEASIETKTKNAATILEPILLAGISLLILFLALAVILPLYSIYGGV